MEEPWAAVLIIKRYLSENWYDNVKYNNFYTNFQSYKTNLLAIPSHQKFLDSVLEVWYWFPILLIAVTVIYLYQQQWLKLLLVWVFCLGYILLLHIGDTESTHRFYAEVNYLSLSIFTGVPLVFDGIAKIKRRQTWIFVVLTLVLVSRLWVIGKNHEPYEDRIQWITENVERNSQQLNTDKLLFEKSRAPVDLLLMTWGVPFESLIISATKDRDQARTLYIPESKSKFERALQSDTAFHSDFRAWPMKSLNQSYFSLEGAYKAVE